MHLRLPLLAAAVFGTAAAHEASSQFWRRNDTDPAGNSTDTVADLPQPSSYIVEYAADDDDAAFRRKNPVGVDVKVIQTFDSEIFHGACVETDEDGAEELLKLSTVARVWPNRRVPLPQAEIKSTFADASASANYSYHGMTGVAALHERGIYGQGIRIGVVDSGVRYTHPALGGGIGEGFKVAGGHDFVGNNNWPVNPKEPSDDPMDYTGHGTHVAGILAAADDIFTGVAPQANIYAYKVFSQNPSTDEATLIDAFLTAYQDGCHIITSSIGGASGWADNVWAEVASRLVEKGVIVTISAGNSGSTGPFFGSSGSSGDEVIAVASVRSNVSARPSFHTTFTSPDGEVTTNRVGYIKSFGFFHYDVVDRPIVPLGLNITVADEACEPIAAADVPDVDFTKSILLVRIGGCTVTKKQGNLNDMGAKMILFYNDDTPLSIYETGDYRSEFALLEKHSGEGLIKAIAEGYKVTADFSNGPDDVVGLPINNAGKPSYFTSWGGLYDLRLKPDVAAPGDDIFSTFTDAWETPYAVLSGTSMSCPYVAGVAALYLSARRCHTAEAGPEIAREVTRRIISTAGTTSWFDDDDAIASPAQLGGGLVNALKVVDYSTTLSITRMALNDTANFVGEHTFDVRNRGRKAITYSFDHEPAAGIDTVGPSEDRQEIKVLTFDELKPTEYVVDVNLPTGFTLQPGESKQVSVVFENPKSKGWEASALPMYSGKILVKGSNNETVAVPYMGVAASIREIFDDPFIDPPLLRVYDSPTEGAISVWDKPYWTNDIHGWRNDWPRLEIRFKWGVRELRWDIYEAGWEESQWEYPPVIGSNGYIGSIAMWENSGEYWNPWSSAEIKYTPFPLTNLYRNAFWSANRHSAYWFGMLANGTEIEPGNYTMRISSLKPYGEREKKEDWAVFATPPEVWIQGKASDSQLPEGRQE